MTRTHFFQVLYQVRYWGPDVGGTGTSGAPLLLWDGSQARRATDSPRRVPQFLRWNAIPDFIRMRCGHRAGSMLQLYLRLFRHLARHLPDKCVSASTYFQRLHSYLTRCLTCPFSPGLHLHLGWGSVFRNSYYWSEVTSYIHVLFAVYHSRDRRPLFYSCGVGNIETKFFVDTWKAWMIPSRRDHFWNSQLRLCRRKPRLYSIS